MTMPNLINDWGLNEVLRRRYNVQEGAPAPTMAMETFPVVDVGPFTPELNYLAGWRLCGGVAIVAAAVGFPSQIMLRNPASSRVLAIIDDFTCITAGAGIFLALYPGELVGALGAANSVPLDTRYQLPAVTTLTTCILSIDNTVASAVGNRNFDFLTAGVDKKRPGPIVLTPGFTFVAYGDANNANLYGSLRWRERRMLPGE